MQINNVILTIQKKNHINLFFNSIKLFEKINYVKFFFFFWNYKSFKFSIVVANVTFKSQLCFWYEIDEHNIFSIREYSYENQIKFKKIATCFNYFKRLIKFSKSCIFKNIDLLNWCYILMSRIFNLTFVFRYEL